MSDIPFTTQTSPFGLVNSKRVSVDNCNAETRKTHFSILRNSALSLIGRDWVRMNIAQSNLIKQVVCQPDTTAENAMCKTTHIHGCW